jgi:hypothetical protein
MPRLAIAENTGDIMLAGFWRYVVNNLYQSAFRLQQCQDLLRCGKFDDVAVADQ